MNRRLSARPRMSSIATGEVAEGLRALAARASRRCVASRAPPQLLGFLGLATGRRKRRAAARAPRARSARDRLAGRCVLQAILPALKAQSARISHPRATPEELWELLLFHAWQAICCYPVARRRRRVAANLVLRVLARDDARAPPGDPPPARQHSSRATRRTPLPAAHGRRARRSPTRRAPRLAAVLPTARAGELAARDAEPILDTRLQDAARAPRRRGRGQGGAPLQRRRRAENRLAQRLAASGESHDTTNSYRSARAE